MVIYGSCFCPIVLHWYILYILTIPFFDDWGYSIFENAQKEIAYWLSLFVYILNLPFAPVIFTIPIESAKLDLR